MNKKSMHYTLKKKVSEIISAIDLNYILAEAQKEKYVVSLLNGNLENRIRWENDICNLSYNYEIATGIIYQYISVHKDKIIKINVSSKNDIYPLNRNIIIYVPYEIDISKVKREYNSVVDYC
ncbi:hypothetical protein QJ856_gp0091 [Tupanvirus deep ocean]|uniref:Uncharacterized protein n=2 Tax=Tupanvirus TaxID=2094720 RepID=A0AC62AA44_9VIRU|nr:hypothetical protein QJ856_gp0091 [Tupanvirus deep ocean]QKU34636.1 hypothetical protein [Tupanvirus deep ocean]